VKCKAHDILTARRTKVNVIGGNTITKGKKYEVLPDINGDLCFLNDSGFIIMTDNCEDSWFEPITDPFDYAMGIL